MCQYAKITATLLACNDEFITPLVAELGLIDPVLYSKKSKKYVPLQSFLELIHMLGNKEILRELAKEILDRLPVIELGER